MAHAATWIFTVWCILGGQCFIWVSVSTIYIEWKIYWSVCLLSPHAYYLIYLSSSSLLGCPPHSLNPELLNSCLCENNEESVGLGKEPHSFHVTSVSLMACLALVCSVLKLLNYRALSACHWFPLNMETPPGIFSTRYIKLFKWKGGKLSYLGLLSTHSNIVF